MGEAMKPPDIRSHSLGALVRRMDRALSAVPEVSAMASIFALQIGLIGGLVLLLSGLTGGMR